jgi:hypothetical protein
MDSPQNKGPVQETQTKQQLKSTPMSVPPTLPTAEEIGTLVPIGLIAKQTPYSADFLRQLARSGKIRAYKLHRDWLTTPAAVRQYLQNQQRRHEHELDLLRASERGLL